MRFPLTSFQLTRIAHADGDTQAKDALEADLGHRRPVFSQTGALDIHKYDPRLSSNLHIHPGVFIKGRAVVRDPVSACWLFKSLTVSSEYTAYKRATVLHTRPHCFRPMRHRVMWPDRREMAVAISPHRVSVTSFFRLWNQSVKWTLSREKLWNRRTFHETELRNALLGCLVTFNATLAS